VSEGSGNWRCWNYQKASGLATIAAPVGWISIASGSFGVGTSLVLTSIPQTYSELLLVAKGVSHDNVGGVGLQAACSVNNGSAYGANAQIVASYAGAGSKDFALHFYHYTGDTGDIISSAGTSPTSPDAATGALQSINTAHTGGCNALKITANGNNFDAGTYVLYGRP
jgi:hypothetical protein